MRRGNECASLEERAKYTYLTYRPQCTFSTSYIYGRHLQPQPDRQRRVRLMLRIGEGTLQLVTVASLPYFLSIHSPKPWPYPRTPESSLLHPTKSQATLHLRQSCLLLPRRLRQLCHHFLQTTVRAVAATAAAIDRALTSCSNTATAPSAAHSSSTFPVRLQDRPRTTMTPTSNPRTVTYPHFPLAFLFLGSPFLV
jgi:hypothetical protein